MCIYSLLFMRFAWEIKPRNMLLFACHASNEVVQLNQLRRYMQHTPDKNKDALAEVSAPSALQWTR